MQDVPYGYCHCGCGRKAAIATRTSPAQGYVRGKPRRYLLGHSGRYQGPKYIEEDRGHDTPCWIWQMALTPAGYGQWQLPRGEKNRLAHTRFWMERHGVPVPDGLVLDHLCRVRACVNPDHLEAVTQAENVRRSSVRKHTAGLAMQARLMRLTTTLTQYDIAEALGTTRSWVQHVLEGSIWRLEHEAEPL